MNKSDLTKILSQERDLPLRKSEEIVDAVFETMIKHLESGNRIEIRGFGSFQIKQYEGYTGRNPKTGENILIKGKKLPFFKTGKDFRENLNKE
jgi:integration host factor subunit beta